MGTSFESSNPGDETRSEFKELIMEIRRLTEAVEASNRYQSKIFDLEELRLALRPIHENILRMRNATENIRTSNMLEIRRGIKDTISDHQLGLVETLDHLAQTGKSFARFGDGEFGLMYKSEFNLPFQSNSPELARELRKVLSEPNENVLLGLPHIFYDVHWSTVIAEMWHEIGPAVPQRLIFGDAHVTRPPLFKFFGERGINAWKRLWENKAVVLVAGKGSRFDLIDELFGNAKSVKRIDSLAVNAFQDIDRVIELVNHEDADVVLIALGPTGTILADRLAKPDRQALDIGHLTASYRMVFEGAKDPESRPLSQ